MSLIVNNSTVKLNVVSDRMINGAPAGGTTNQLLAKNSNADYDFKYVSAGSGSGVVVEVVAGTNVTVDNTDPAFPIVSASGGGGAVASVNGETGAVVLDYADVGAAPALGTNDNYVTDAEKTKLANLSGTNTGDQDLSGINSDISALEHLSARFDGNGIESGMALSINADPTKFNISSGVYHNATVNPPVNITYAGVTAQTVTNLLTQTVTYVAINGSGIIIQSAAPFTPEERRLYTVLGALIHTNKTTINAINNLPDVSAKNAAQFNDLLDSLRMFNIEGNDISPNGANMFIDKSVGRLFKRGVNFSISANNPHVKTMDALVAPATIRYRLSDSTEYADTNSISLDYESAPGVRSTIPSGSFSIQRIALFASNLIRIQYGATLYGTLALARQGILTDAITVEKNIADNGLFISYLIIAGNCTDLTNTARAVFISTDRFGQLPVGYAGGTTTLQQAYDNSIAPEIVTNATLDGFTIRRGSAADTDHVFEIQNGAGSVVAYITGEGVISVSNLSNVDNTSDVNKPVSTAQQTALNGKFMYHGCVLKPLAAVPTHLTSTTFTLGATANPCSYYYQGVLVSVTSNKTTTLSGAAGKYYIFFDAATGNLSNSTSFPGVLTTSNVLVASVIWNGADYGVVNYEMHGHDRNHSWHLWAHSNIGTLYNSGITLTHNSGTGAAATFATTSGDIADEDINFTVGASSGFPTANACRLWRQSAASTYVFNNTPSTVPYWRGTGDRPVYIDSSTFAITTLPSATNRYVNYFFFATTDRHTPIYCVAETAVAGTILSGYTTTALARAIPFPNLSNTNMSAELKPIYRLVVRADGAVQALIAADDYRIVSSVPQGAGISSTTASAVSFTPSGTIAAATVQTALEEIDTEKQATLVSATNIKTINGSSVLGSGDLTVSAAAMVMDMTLIGAGTVASPLKKTDFTDFMSATTTAHAPWTGAAISSGTSAAVDGTAEHPGMVTMRGFTSANGGYRYQTTNNSMVIKGGEHFELVFYTNVLSAARIRFGYFDTNTAVDAVNGAFINIDTTTLTGQTAAASTRTSTASSYTLSLTTFYRGVIDINTAKTLVTFTLYAENGTQLWQDTLNTNIPTAVLGHGVMGWDTSTANNIMVRLDAMAQGQTGVFVR